VGERASTGGQGEAEEGEVAEDGRNEEVCWVEQLSEADEAVVELGFF
jgi:hypothetical protein